MPCPEALHIFLVAFLGGCQLAFAPAWVSGMTWKEGGCYYSETINSEIWLNCYAESGQGGPFFKYHGGMIGGTWEPNPNSAGFFFESGGAGPRIKTPNFRVTGSIWSQPETGDGVMIIASPTGSFYPYLAFVANGSVSPGSGPRIYGPPDNLLFLSESHGFFDRSQANVYAEINAAGIKTHRHLQIVDVTNASPLNGDVWYESGVFKYREAGVTRNLTQPISFSSTQRVLGRNSAGGGAAEEVDPSQFLNWIGSTRGSILYKAAGTAWSALVPAAANTFLRSNGVGSDPSYAAVTAANVGLGNVDNTSDANKPVSTAQQTALNLKANLTANSFSATQTIAGAVNHAAYVNSAPVNGDIWNNAGVLQYREGGVTKNLTQTFTPSGSITASGYTMNTARFLGRTTAAVGAVEELTAAQLKTALTLVKGDVGLGNVDNTSDANKPVSTAQAAADALKANLAGGNTFTGAQIFNATTTWQNPSATRYGFGLSYDIWSAGSINFQAWDSIAGAAIPLDFTGNPIRFRHGSTLVLNTTSVGAAAGVVNLIPGANASPVNGDIWYDSTAGKFKKREAGVTSDLDTGTGTLADDSVTFAKMQNLSGPNKLIGRATAAAGDPEELGLGAGLTMSGSNVQLNRTLYTLANAHSNNTVTTTIVGSNTADADWSIAMVAGKTYRITIMANYQTAATTTGGTMALVGSGGIAGNVQGMMWGGITNAAAASTLEVPLYTFAGAAGSLLTTTGVVAINSPHIWGADFIFNCTTSGTLNIQWASEVAASAAQLNVGASMLVEVLN